MGYSVLLLLCLLHVYVFSHGLDNELNQYLNDIRDNFLTEYASRTDINFSSTINFNGTSENPFIISLTNSTYVLFTFELFQINNEKVSNKFILPKMKNGTEISFIKFIEYNKEVYLMVKLASNVANIYVVTSKNVIFVQSLPAEYTSDGRFFINNKSLYLIVGNNKNEALAPTTVYKWLGSYFDEIQTIFTIGAIKVSSFTTAESEILIILQAMPQKNLAFSKLYHFQDDSAIEIQRFKTLDPIDVDTFVCKEKNHLIIFQKSYNSVYGWDGKQVRRIFDIKTNVPVGKHAIFNQGPTFLLFPSSNNMQVYQLCPRNIKVAEYRASNYSIILDVGTRKIGNNITTFMAASQKNNRVSFATFSFDIDYDKTEVDSLKQPNLHDCFDQLLAKVFALKQKHQSVQNSQLRAAENLERVSNYEARLNNITNRLDKLEKTINSHRNITINGTLIINGTVKIEKVLGTNIQIENLNDRKWNPDQWLKYEKSQKILGSVKASSLNVRNLETSLDNTIFENWLLNGFNQIITGSVKVKTLQAKSINTDTINDVEISDVYLKEEVKIIKNKHFENLKVNTAEIDVINGQQSMESLTNKKSLQAFSDNLSIMNLTVETLNDIAWNNFTKSVFRYNISKVINGSLIAPKIRTSAITVSTLNDQNPENFLTTSTNQTIEADIIFNRIFAKNITADDVNGVNLDDIVKIHDNITIFGPVTFEKLHVSNNLIVPDKIDDSVFGNKSYIKKSSDLLQTYEGKILMKGNLFINNLTLESDSHLFVKDEEMLADVLDKYWTKTTKQVIPVPVTFYKQVTVPHILANKLNGINFKQFMMNNTESFYETNFIFENVTVLGNVILNENANHKPNFNQIAEEGVNITGNFIINGKKVYKDTLKVEELTATEIGNIKVHELLNTTIPTTVKGTKHFKSLIVKQNVSSFIEHIDKINNINLSNLLNTTLNTNEMQILKSLNFKSVEVKNLYIKNLNGQHIEDRIKKTPEYKSFNKIKKLIVTKNATITNLTNVTNLNNIEFDTLMKKALFLKNEKGFKTDIVFKNNLKIRNLSTLYINGMNMQEKFSNLLHRTYQQNITAPYNFTSIIATNINTPKINHIHVNNLIDVSTTKKQSISTSQDLIINSAKFLKSLNPIHMKPCTIEELHNKINNPPSQEWNKIEIKQNVTLWDETSSLHRIIEKTVRINSNNSINAAVLFGETVTAYDISIQGNINDINLTHIVEDAVFVNSNTEQIISSTKWFHRMGAFQVRVKKNADVLLVNDENVELLNLDIIKKSSTNTTVIKGTKTFFGGLQTKALHAKLISNINPDNIVTLDKPNEIPEAIFDTIRVEKDFNFSYVNRIFNFSDIMNNRLLINQSNIQEMTGVYHFNNIEIQNLTTLSINNISIDDVVFNNLEDFKNISSEKYFLDDVEFFADLSLDVVNGVNITETYQNSVCDGNNLTISGNAVISMPSRLENVIHTESVNNYPIATFYEILNNSNIETEIEDIYKLKLNITENLRYSHSVSGRISNEFMYLEKSDSLPLSISNISSISTLFRNGYVLIYVNTEDHGEYCGLPSRCKCPVQYTIEISPHRSINVFPNKGFQRVFNYDDNIMNVFFLTDSISNSRECSTGRNNISNEMSMMIWDTVFKHNNTNNFYQYPKNFWGYIRKVEFFTYNRNSYAIIGRYYDPVQDTYELDSFVMKFNEERSSVSKIQNIPTRGLRELKIIDTAQHIILVIGNVLQNEEDTHIYMFEPHTEQFVFLRAIPMYGCLEATGITLGVENFIVLRSTNGPVEILKYFPEFDNYFHYESFDFTQGVIALSVFSTQGSGLKQVYVCVVTSEEYYYIYSYKLSDKWILVSNGFIEGLRGLVPLQISQKKYLLAISNKISSLMAIVENGSF